MDARTSVFFIGPVLLLMGLFVVYRAISLARRAGASRGWPAVPGKVVSSGMRRVLAGRGRGSLEGPAGISESRYAYVPEVRFSYSVAGRQYEGDRYRADLSQETERVAQAVVARYPEGAAVKVFYDPENPDRAVLETGGRTALLGCSVALGLFFAFLGLLITGVAVLVSLVR